MAKLLYKNERLHKEIEHLKKIYKDQFDSIKKTRALSKEHCDSLIAQLNSKSLENADLKGQIQEKVFVTTALQSELRRLKGKHVIDNSTTITNATTIIPGMFKLDIEPLSHRLKNNRDAYEDYLKKTIENTDTIRRLVERARKQIPSELLLDSTCKFIKHVFQIVLWYLDSGCSKHMTVNHSQLKNFVSKFLGTVRFENDQVAKIMRYGNYHLGNIIISMVYYVEGLGHNLFSVRQFYDTNLEVAFRKNTCFIQNLEGVDMLSGSRNTNLYTNSLDDMLKNSPIYLLSKALKTKSWLWHHRLSHLNFDTLNKLANDGLTRRIPKLKSQKDHMCSACALGKSKKCSHQPKVEDTNQEKLYLLHMDLCGPMRVESINGKKYILVFVVDYSRFTWVKFLRSKDEAPKAIIKCIKNIQVRLNATVCNVRTDNGTEFVNQTLPARTMLIFSKAPLFLLAEAINTACYTQNRSLIRLRYNKTPYELMHDKKSDLSFLHVFGSLCYPTNDSKDLGKLNAKADIGIFVGYTPTKKAFKIYNRRTWKIMETIHVMFNELTAMASKQFGTGPGLQVITPVTSSSRLVPNLIPQQPCNPPNRDDWDRLFQLMFDEYFNPPTIAVSPVPVAAAPRAVDIADSHVSTSIDQDAPSTSIPLTQEQEHSPIISQGVKESPKTP
ncbi:retrovirus-related pol polyprotein from transposon TNT 1-94 [Tanacetum coccineum]